MVDLSDDYEYNNLDEINAFIAIKNPFRYRSYYYDFETNLYYLNSRYYDPETGRFINADDITTLDVTKITLNGLNLYAYCLNNPVNEIDEDGNMPKWLKWLIGGLIIITAVALTVITAGGFAGASAAIAGALGIGSTVSGAAGFFAGVAVGAFVAGGIGMLSGGFSSLINGGSFWDGAADGFMWGTIGGALSGGFGTFFNKTGIIFGKSGKAVGSIPQIIGQSVISSGVYIAQSFSNGNKPTFIGIIASLFGAISGGLIAFSTFSTQFVISFLSESIKVEFDGLKKLLSKLLNFNSQSNNWFW